MEVIIEFKWGSTDNPFREPFGPSDNRQFISDTDKGMDTLGQITSYAAAQLGAQYRTHIFSVLIVHDQARIIRWDREGAIVTRPIFYNVEPHLVNFFSRYAQATPQTRGVDTSVTPADLAWEYLKLPDPTRMFKVEVPAAEEGSESLTLIIPAPVARGFPPVGRGTRTCPALNFKNKKVVMFKDSWRIALPDISPEGDTYKLLKTHNVRNVATCIACHDVPHLPQQHTKTFKFAAAPWACSNKVLTPHAHYRLVLNLVGEALTDFSHSREFVQSVRDALIGKYFQILRYNIHIPLT